jgi:hypothetical protein
VDFGQLASLTDPALAGWDFSLISNCPGWVLKDGKLQVKDFASFDKTCGFLMPAVGASDFQKYGSFTLSVVQTLHINSTPKAVGSGPIQSASISNAVGSDIIWSATGQYPRQTLAINLDKSAIPGSRTFQPLFQISSSVPGGGYTGWQIESIAINGVP